MGLQLQMLKEQLSHAHGEYLEWIGKSPTLYIVKIWGDRANIQQFTVIILIAAEIFVGLINIAVDILAEGNE